MNAMHLPGFPSPYLQVHLAPGLHNPPFFLSQLSVLILSYLIVCFFILSELHFQWVWINQYLGSAEELNYQKYCAFPASSETYNNQVNSEAACYNGSNRSVWITA